MHKMVFALALLLPGAAAVAGPKISWTYHNTPAQCHNECKREVLGQCIETRRVCNSRTRNWTTDTKAVIKRAMNLLSSRINTSRVRSCITKHTKKYRGIYARSGSLASAGKVDLKALSRVEEWPLLHLRAERENVYTTGSAYLERVARGSKLSGDRYRLSWSNEINMYINLSAITYWKDREGFEEAANIYAGTIVHELMHQMGHNHPDGDYDQGHFIVVVGDCVANNGAGARSPSSGFGLVGSRNLRM